MPATYKDIQRMTGLSLSTISRYFNALPVRPANAEAIEDAAGKLQFRTNSFAKSLRTRKSMTIGVLLPDLANAFHSTIVANVIKSPALAGYGVIVSTYGDSASGLDRAVRFLTGKMVDGLIMVPPGDNGWPTALDVEQPDLPIVVLDRVVWHPLDHVVVDNDRAGADVADLLAEAGHRDIGVVGGPDDISSLRGRTAGFTARLADRGIALPQSRVLRRPLTVEAGRLAALELLSGPGPRPTALFATNSELTVGSMLALAELSLTTPGDLSFVGFDNAELSQAVPPGLAVVLQPVEEIARRASELMRLRLDTGVVKRGESVVLLCALAPGRSVGPPPA
ncbi:MAG: LacI family transcriptional regulator [Bifidobacteriaceae bacterium]|jgi:DNA-binding LacI/PurR family transcriptional regulator|nr:LacI family transcriptional regulator [Bifidobacteriaceae bacterium]